MTPKDQMLYDIAEEIEARLIKNLPAEIDQGDVQEFIKIIRRAEYKRGKADGLLETTKR